MSKGKKPKRKPTKPRQEAEPMPIQPISESEKRSWWTYLFDKTWKIVIGISIVITIVTGWIAIRNEWFKSAKRKADDETTWQDTLNPPRIITKENNPVITSEGHKLYLADTLPNFTYQPLKNFPKVKGIRVTDFDLDRDIYVQIGDHVFYLPTEDFYKGIDVLKQASQNCTNVKLILGLKDNRLYVSTEFKRLQGEEETLGIIEFNHWTVFKEYALRYPLENDTMFEVRDQQNKIVFSIKYGGIGADILHEGHPTQGVIIRGYFIGDTSIAVVKDLYSENVRDKYCISKSEPNWKQKAGLLISEIKSIF